MMGRLRILALTAGLLATLPATAVELAARVDWGERYTVTTPLGGVVREIAVRPGDLVEADQVLFTLDTRRLRADARAVEAEIERLGLDLSEADREVERAAELYDRTLIAVRELELARIQRAMAAARLARAQAEQQRIRIDLDDSRIRAPAAGRVLTVGVTIGEAINPTLAPPVLATIGSTDPMRAEATIDSALASDLRPGQTLSVDIGTGEIYTGTIRSIGWEAEDIGFGPGYRLEVRFSPPETLQLRSGQPAHLRLGDTE
jgi:RND family efflux transporter MFP subunit